MDKYINLNEYETTQLLLGIDNNEFDKEIIHAVCASNVVAVGYMLSKIRDPFLLATSLMCETTDVLVAEKILESIEFTVFARLNSCLTKMKTTDVLAYLVNHDVARFDLSYNNSECLRHATMNNDYEKVKMLMTCRQRMTLKLTWRGNDTFGKSSIELAFKNNNDDILRLFLNSGLRCAEPSFSIPLIEKITEVVKHKCSDRIKSRRQIFELYMSKSRSTRDIVVPEDVLNKAFPETQFNERLGYLKVKSMVRSLR